MVSGSASITAPGATTLITQTSQKAIIDWQDFSVAAGQTVQFAQPNRAAVTLNRVTGSSVSDIQGAVKANGQVWLINPNGVLFGQGATVHVGGLLATTVDIADNDFVSGNYAFGAAGSNGGITNNGVIRAARGGSVVLSAPQVTNRGLIQANAGHVVLGGADAFTVDFNGDRLLSYAITAPVAHDGKDAGGNTQSATVSNSGIIRAAGGKILLTARAAANVADSVVNNSGIVRATSAHMDNGDIILDAGDGTAEAGGTLDASGKAAGQTGGSVQVLGKTVQVADGAKIDVSGDAGGGQVLIGGNFHGAGPQQDAQTAAVGKATITADAIGSGNGGKVAVWSNGQTTVAGVISAKGGVRGGDGGQVETSGHDLNVAGAVIDASAPNGAAGSWLLDPYNLTVSNTTSTATQSPTGTWTSNANGPVVLNTDINSALNSGTSVVLQTSGSLGDGFGNGDITVSAPIQMTGVGAAGLTLKAGGSVIVNQGISSSGGALALTLDANTLGGGGYVNITAPIATNGGALVIGGGANPLTTAAAGTATQVTGVLVAGTLNTGSGALTIHGTGYGGVAGDNNYGVWINAAVTGGGGAISITGTGGGSNGNSNFGIYQSAAIANSGTGSITLNGTGGGTGNMERGYYATGASANITAGTGNISLTGSGSTMTGSGGGGVIFGGGETVSTAGAGTITISGTATFAGGNGVGFGATITAVDGLINITGINNSTGGGTGFLGVNVGGTIKSTGVGGITVTGTGGGSGAGGADVGVNVAFTNAIQSTGGGAITITGTGGDNGGSGSNNFGVNLANEVDGSGGAILITGTGGNSSGSNNYGINQNAAVTNSGTGSITLIGTGGGSGGGDTNNDGEVGTKINGNITAGTGNISIAGTASDDATGFHDDGISFDSGTISTTGAGTITLSGLATGSGTGGASFGVGIEGGTITAVNGLITVTGINESTGTDGDKIGVLLSDNGAITSTGSGGVSILGAGGGTGAALIVPDAPQGAPNGDIGVVIYTTAGGIQSTGGGAISIIGEGGDTSGTGTGNYGVFIGTSLAAGGASLSIEGIGGSSSGNNNYGVYQAAAISSGSGTMSLGGAGGGTGSGEAGYYTVAPITAGSGGISIVGNISTTATGTGNNAIDLHGTLSSSGFAVLIGDGDVTDGYASNPAGAGNILAQGGLTVSSSQGAISLTNPANAVSGYITLNALTNATFFNSVATSLGTSAVGGTLTVQSASDLTLNAGATLTSTASGGDGVILVVGRNFTNNSTATAVHLDNGARGLGYFQSPANLSGPLFNSGNTAIWNTSYPTPITAPGSRYVFAALPILIVTSTDVTKSAGTDATAAVAAAYTIAGLNPGISGAFLGDSAAAVYSGTPSVTSAGSPASASASGSPYAITVSAGSFTTMDGYGVSFASSGLLTFGSGGVLTYVANPFSRTYGTANPTFTGTVTGFAPGGTLANSTSGTLVFTSSATASSPVGSYAINGSGLTSQTYTFVQAPSNATALTITAALLSYTASQASRTYGAANPAFTGTVTGFAPGDTLANATTGTLVFTSPAVTSSDAGSYPITGSGLSASSNYVFGQAAGNSTAFTINKASLTTALTGSVSKIYDGTTIAVLSAANFAALTGIIGNDNVALVFPSTGTYDTANVGTGKTVTASGLSLSGAKANDYSIAASVSAPIGEITGVEAPAAPVLTSIVAASQASASTASVSQSTSITTFINAQTALPPPPPPAAPTATATTTYTLASAPTIQNPLESLVLSSSTTAVIDQPAPEPPTSSDVVTDLVVASMDGGFTPDGGGSNVSTSAATNRPVIIIPGLLNVVPARTQTIADSGDDLSAWGNPALWQ